MKGQMLDILPRKPISHGLFRGALREQIPQVLVDEHVDAIGAQVDGKLRHPGAMALAMGVNVGGRLVLDMAVGQECAWTQGRHGPVPAPLVRRAYRIQRTEREGMVEPDTHESRHQYSEPKPFFLRVRKSYPQIYPHKRRTQPSEAFEKCQRKGASSGRRCAIRV
ncbi:MAG: hypothetical protein ABMA14_18710 [Hyphomonadaceae bacterium]